jgi:hypothetical protein
VRGTLTGADVWILWIYKFAGPTSCQAQSGAHSSRVFLALVWPWIDADNCLFVLIEKDKVTWLNK